VFGVVRVESPDFLELFAVGLVGEALDQPVNGWVKEAHVLVVRQVGVADLGDVVVEFEHVLNHQD